MKERIWVADLFCFLKVEMRLWAPYTLYCMNFPCSLQRCSSLVPTPWPGNPVIRAFFFPYPSLHQTHQTTLNCSYLNPSPAFSTEIINDRTITGGAEKVEEWTQLANWREYKKGSSQKCVREKETLELVSCVSLWFLLSFLHFFSHPEQFLNILDENLSILKSS